VNGEIRLPTAPAHELKLRRQAQAQTYASDMKVAQQALAQTDLGRALGVLNCYLPRPVRSRPG
jgi:hypothetical protein